MYSGYGVSPASDTQVGGSESVISQIGEAFANVATAVTPIFARNDNAQTTPSAVTTYQTPGTGASGLVGDKTLLYVGIGAVVLVGLYLLTRRK